MSMLIILAVVAWLAAMTLVATMCLVAARADAAEQGASQAPVGEPSRFARVL